MQKGIIGKKIGMTQIFDENGKVVPVTVVEAGPCTVVQKKTVESDGYVEMCIRDRRDGGRNAGRCTAVLAGGQAVHFCAGHQARRAARLAVEKWLFAFG